MIKKLKWIIHPISILILAQICWGLLMFVWIRWYILRSQEINALLTKIPLSTAPSGQWVILAEGCLLMAFLLVSLYMIFVSQRRLSRITKMQDTILSSVTHELKTPLASIRLYTETMLLREIPIEEKKKFLNRVLGEVERLQKLVDTILISARLNSDHSTTNNHIKIDLIEIINTSMIRMKERFDHMRLFEFQIIPENAPRSFYILGNSQHLSTLFDNLFDNAVKYTKKNDLISVELSLGNENILVSVHDNGIGIEKRDLKKIFKKFYRVDKSAKSKVTGSGLGLSVCHSIVKEHNGKIYAKSDGLNKGTTFYVEFKRFPSYC
jgi:signal transduction histidine kinase